MTVDLHNYRIICSDKAWKCRDRGHSDECYRRDPRLQAIANAYKAHRTAMGEGQFRDTENYLFNLLDVLTEKDNDG